MLRIPPLLTKGQRVYSVYGKSVCLSVQPDGQGSNTRLYKIDLPDEDYVSRKLTPIEAESFSDAAR